MAFNSNPLRVQPSASAEDGSSAKNGNSISSSSETQTLSKDEAAQFLGVSSRALERYTASGRVAVAYAPGKTRSVAVYERAELEKLKAELQRPLLRGASNARSASDAASAANQETSTTPTRTPTTGDGAAPLPVKADEVWDGQTSDPIPPNPDTVTGAVSDELVAVSSGSVNGAENALDTLTQLVLERLLERLNSEAGLAAASLPSTPSVAGSALVLAATGSVPRAPFVATGEKLLLTLPEAAALTGLSRAFLKGVIRDGTLVAKPIGRLWRIKRADLDAFIAAL